MILLDTDHLTTLKYGDTDRYRRLTARLAQVGDEPVGITVVSVEEQFRGWLACIAKERQARRQVHPYDQLAGLFDFLSAFDIARFDERAADLFDTFGRIQVKAMDKKIAAIAVVNNALLLTANRSDFEKIPGLRFDNWMDPPPTTGS